MWDSNRPTNRIRVGVIRAVRERDQDTCQLRYTGCTGGYEQIDHIRNVASTGLDRTAGLERPDDLQCVCRHCHNIKTQAEAKAAINRWKRTPERHPGLL
jgi:5-methylcytosine-specific restriction endonuclease McrA